MTAKAQKQEQEYAQTITSQIEALLPNAKVYDLGATIIVSHPNGSISNVYPLTDTIVDFTSKLYTDQSIDQHDMPVQKCLAILQRIDALVPRQIEQSSTAQVAPVQAPSTPHTKGYDMRKPDPIIPTSDWWPLGKKRPVGNDQSVNEDATGTEPLGKDDRKEKPDRSIRHDFKGDSPLALEFANALAELARESGRADAILKGKSHDETNEDWQTVPDPFSSDSDTPEDDEDCDLEEFLRSLVAPHLRGDTTHGGKPVSLNENRDVSRPFADTMAGKVLVDLGRANGGVQFVDRSVVPPKRMLSNGDNGVEFVTENVNRYPLRYTAHGYEETKPTKPLFERWNKIISK